MENLERFIGKKVLITVAFCTGAVDAGSVPQKFIGVVEKDNNNSIELSDVKIEIRAFTSISYKECLY